jgi:oxalate decarboxylase
VENTGSTTARALEMFKSSYYADLSLNQWPALAPPELLKVHLDLDQQFADALRKTKAPIVPT